MSFWTASLLILAIYCIGIPLSVSTSEKNEFKRAPATNEACGNSASGSRIVGGTTCDISNFPFLAAITSLNGKFIQCGGALISDTYILTSAECFRSFQLKKGPPFDISVAMGISSNKEIKTTMKPVQIIRHETFIEENEKAIGIALVKLEKPVKFNNKIRPICLPKSGDDFGNKQGAIAGWGQRHSKSFKEEQKLKKASVKILNFKTCGEMLKRKLNSTVICGLGDGTNAPCTEDWGNPLFVNDNGQFKVVGITSYSGAVTCGKQKSPIEYSDVQSYVQWIIQKTGGVSCKG